MQITYEKTMADGYYNNNNNTIDVMIKLALINWKFKKME